MATRTCTPATYATVHPTVAPNDEFVLQTGLYRRVITRPNVTGLRMVFEEGAILKGSESWSSTNWTQDATAVSIGANVWRHAWVWPIMRLGSSPSDNGEDINNGYAANKRREMFEVEEVNLVQISVGNTAATPTSMAEGQFWVEGRSDGPVAVYLRMPDSSSPNGVTFEVGTREFSFVDPGAADFVLENLTVEGDNTDRQRFAVVITTHGAEVTGFLGRRNRGGAIKVVNADYVTLRDVTTVDNGIEGIGQTGGTGVRWLNVDVQRNCWQDAGGRNHGGGGKFTRTQQVEVTGRFVNNFMHGFWLDEMNDDSEVHHCVIGDNVLNQVLIELGSNGGRFHHNHLYGGQAFDGNARGYVLEFRNVRDWEVDHNQFDGGFGDVMIGSDDRSGRTTNTKGPEHYDSYVNSVEQQSIHVHHNRMTSGRPVKATGGGGTDGTGNGSGGAIQGTAQAWERITSHSFHDNHYTRPTNATWIWAPTSSSVGSSVTVTTRSAWEAQAPYAEAAVPDFDPLYEPPPVAPSAQSAGTSYVFVRPPGGTIRRVTPYVRPPNGTIRRGYPYTS